MANGDKDYNYQNEPTLTKVQIGKNPDGTPKYYWLKDTEARDVIDIILNDYLTSADKAQLVQDIANEASNRVAADQQLTSDISNEASTARAAESAINTALAAENTARTTKDADLQRQIDEIEEGLVKVKSGDKILAINASKELNTTLTINYDSTNRKIQLKGIGDTLVSEIDASAFIKDGMLWGEKAFVATGTSQEVSITKDSITQTHIFTGLTEGHQYLAFCFTDGAVPTPTYSWDIVDLQDLVDVYTAGDGLDLNDHEFTVKRDSSSDSYFSVSSAGIKIAGIASDIANEAANRAAADDAINAAKEDKSALKELAYKNKADVVAAVQSKTIPGVTATYTPSGTINVTLTNNTVKTMDTAGTAYTITNGSVTKDADTWSKFVKKAIKIDVDSADECLIISDVADTDTTYYANAVTASGQVHYTKQELSGALPTFSDKTIAVDAANTVFNGTQGTANVADIVVPAQNAAITDK